MRRGLCVTLFVLLPTGVSSAQQEMPPSRCMAIADAAPGAVFASLGTLEALQPMTVQSSVEGDVTIT